MFMALDGRGDERLCIFSHEAGPVPPKGEQQLFIRCCPWLHPCFVCRLAFCVLDGPLPCLHVSKAPWLSACAIEAVSFVVCLPCGMPAGSKVSNTGRMVSGSGTNRAWNQQAGRRICCILDSSLAY